VIGKVRKMSTILSAFSIGSLFGVIGLTILLLNTSALSPSNQYLTTFTLDTDGLTT